MTLAGWATEAGTERYRQRHRALHPDHFRQFQGVWASSIGLGTYLGDPDEQTDQLYAEAIETALTLGCNLIDTAINYRCQRSERVIGHTLVRLIQQGTIARDEIILCTKGGYIPFEGEVPADPGRYLIDTFLRPGIIQYDDLVAGCHVLSPRYLEHQLTTSLQNLGVSTLDVYYVHNPEQQLEEIPRQAFFARLEDAFRFLERKVTEGTIRFYGTATWGGLRANPNTQGYLSLHELIELARRVGGDHHHFRVVQLPYNLSLPEAHTFKNQTIEGTPASLLEAAAHHGLSVVISASLLQSQLTHLPGAMGRLIPGLATDAQRAIQFVRSTPGVTTALVGMKQQQHVEQNLKLAQMSLLTSEQVAQLFVKVGRSHASQPQAT